MRTRIYRGGELDDDVGMLTDEKGDFIGTVNYTDAELSKAAHDISLYLIQRPDSKLSNVIAVLQTASERLGVASARPRNSAAKCI